MWRSLLHMVVNSQIAERGLKYVMHIPGGPALAALTNKRHSIFDQSLLNAKTFNISIRVRPLSVYTPLLSIVTFLFHHFCPEFPPRGNGLLCKVKHHATEIFSKFIEKDKEFATRL